MKVTTEQPTYPNRFLKREAAEAYAQHEYGAETYATVIWAIQSPLVRSLLQEVRQKDANARHLDFACGTGRITRLAEEIFAEVDALDISPAMVEVARSTGRQARFFVGNILEAPELCPGPYSSITSFRLLLNIDPPLRVPVLAQLHRRLKPDGRLVVNLHGHRNSLRQPAIIWKRWKHRNDPARDELMLNDMSRDEVEDCLEAAGFLVERVYGTGLLPPTCYRWPLSSLWRGLDRWLSSISWLERFCIDLIFVCKRRNPPAE